MHIYKNKYTCLDVQNVQGTVQGYKYRTIQLYEHRETHRSHNHYNRYNQSHKGRTRVGTDLKGLFAIGPLQQFP